MATVHYLSIGTALLESLLIAGNFYGWPSLQYVLTKEGFFSQLCANATAQPNRTTNETEPFTCAAAEERFNLVFQVSLVCLNVFTIVFGYALDRWGTWVVRSVACALLLCGYAMLSLANAEQSWILYPSMAGISTGGFLLIVTNTQLGVLVPNHRSLYITLLNGLFDSGTVVYLLFKVGYDRGMQPVAFYSAMVALSALSAVRTFFFTPRYSISSDDKPLHGIRECGKDSRMRSIDALDADEAHAITDDDAGTRRASKTNIKKSQPEQPAQRDIPSFKACLFSKLYIGYVAFYSACYVRYVFVLGSAIAWLSGFHGSEGVSFYTEMLGYMLTGGAVVAPINGFIADRVMGFYRKRVGDPGTVVMRGLFAQVTLTALLHVLLSVSILLKSLHLSFVLLTVFRAFLFGTAFNFIAQAFPAAHFGKLMGVTQALVGVASLFQYALFKLATDLDGGFTLVNCYLLVVSVLCAGQPLFLYWKAFRRNLKRKFRETRNGRDAGL